MLETKIEELIAAVKALTEALNRPATATESAPQVVKEPKAKKVFTEVIEVEVASIKPAKKEEEAPNEKQQTTTDTSPPSESESVAVTYDDVKKATNALSAAKGRDVTIDTLSRFGVKRATELDEGQWADYIGYAEKVTGEEV